MMSRHLPIQLPPRGGSTCYAQTYPHIAPLVMGIPGDGFTIYNTTLGEYVVKPDHVYDEGDAHMTDAGRHVHAKDIQRALYFVVGNDGELLFAFKLKGFRANLESPLYLRATEFWRQPFMRIFWTMSRNGRHNNELLQQALIRGEVSWNRPMSRNSYSRLAR